MSQISKISGKQQSPGIGLSGENMDRKVEKKTPLSRTLAIGGTAVVVMLFAWWVFDTLAGGRSLSVNLERIVVSDVTVGTFEDFVPLRGRVVPNRTVFLDAIEGGRVEQVLVEDGTLVEAGEPIAVLSNTNLQLEVLGRDAAVTEQLNNMRTIELQLEQNRLSHRRNLIEINYQVGRLTRSIKRQEDLASRNLVSMSTVDELRHELDYYRDRLEVTLDSQETDARMQGQQLRQLRAAGSQLEASLGFARKNIDDLNVRAPVAGKLSGFNIEVGQSITRGGRLGQIDDPDAYKLNVRIDEYYLGRVDLQQQATAEHNGRDLALQISKIYPQVNEGQFEVDMQFNDEPVGLRRGQTLQLRLTLSDNTQATLIKNGSFYQETGGNWVFVVSANGSEAVRRTVRLGRRNSNYIEVIEGLEVGERVITSPYSSYTDMDRLTLNAN